MRSIGGPTVNAIEEQKVFVTTKRGKKISLGLVLPEAHHIRDLKSTYTLFSEFKGLIDEAAREQGKATAKKKLGAEASPAATELPLVGRARRDS